MKSSAEIISDVKQILSTKWETRDGKKVPEAEELRLGNDAVILEGTVLYADLTDSTGLVNNFKDWFAAEIYKSYLSAACNIIRNNSGTITAFDGDRVMAVYIGGSKNSNAAKSALQINFIVNKINQEIKSVFPSTSFELKQTIGIDTSKLFVARTGVRSFNDLVWVGRAANYAAKLCSISESKYTVSITEAVFNSLSDDTKNGGNPKRCMWDTSFWSQYSIPIYVSNWIWSF